MKIVGFFSLDIFGALEMKRFTKLFVRRIVLQNLNSSNNYFQKLLML